MKKIEDYITHLNAAEGGKEAFDIFSEIMSDFGYEKVAYGFATDHRSLGVTRQHGLASNFPDEWMSHYAQNKLIEIDPIPNYVMQNSLPSFWKPIANDAAEQEKQILRDAADCGLKDGAIIPLYSKGGDIAGLSLSSSFEHEEQSFETLARIQFIGTYFHEKYKEFLKETDEVELTDKELQILIWASEGKTDEEIGLIINRNVNTVRYHWKSISTKLNTYGKTAAIVKAIRLQIITPYHILKNYQKW